MPKNKIRGRDSHSSCAGPYERPQEESGRGANGPGDYHSSQGSGWGHEARVGGHNSYEGPGRAANPALRFGGANDQGFHAAERYDTYGREHEYSHFDKSQQGINDGMDRIVMIIRNMMALDTEIMYRMRKMSIGMSFDTR
ncbi:uncharacterized protein FMAN_05494 [Fusarium mangiferae]|uniref:Uncharacterized protein n=1 Tax=Fusarium mangiferae TaxID=192010 RepID=A0A1L7SMB5_FUSMA|nr:uncharacterized protein FMAN_05494 [Fusarium mangiferae]CVK87554.1 uncharacterized protein FMAN_05494 [Fusarium mangiferae]